MDMNGSNEKGLESNGSSGHGIPVDWQSQFSSSYSCPPVQPMMDSFAVLSDVNAVSAARGGDFMPPVVSGFLPPGLAHFSVDSGFIERAARSSCFGGGAMGANVFGAAEPAMNPLSGSSEGFLNHQRKDANAINEKAEPEHCRNGHEDAPSSEAAAGDCSSKGSDCKKRRRPNEPSSLPADSANESVQSKDKGEEVSPATTTGRSKGKGAKETAESQKEDYIHVRARRGQATNSHSLAERLRREKISERMKLLQDLVPGCSKVTGKAVMLDEIINYVQSLQRQVEFLSMKLATVNPRLDLNIEGLLSKDLLRFPGVPSPSIGFPPEMMQPQLQLSQPGLLQGSVPAMANPEVIRRSILSQLNAKGGFREPASQMPHTLDGSFHDIAQMAYPSLGSQDLSISSSRDAFPM